MAELRFERMQSISWIHAINQYTTLSVINFSALLWGQKEILHAKYFGQCLHVQSV